MDTIVVVLELSNNLMSTSELASFQQNPNVAFGLFLNYRHQRPGKFNDPLR